MLIQENKLQHVFTTNQILIASTPVAYGEKKTGDIALRRQKKIPYLAETSRKPTNIVFFCHLEASNHDYKHGGLAALRRQNERSFKIRNL